MYISDTQVLDFPGRHRQDERVIAGVTKQYRATLKASCGGKTMRPSLVWRANAGTGSKTLALLNFQYRVEGETTRSKMVTEILNRSVSHTHPVENRVNIAPLCLAPFFEVFHQSVACSNNLAASLAWCSQLVFQFFFCLDRHHWSTQGWFCATNPLFPPPPSPPFAFIFHLIILFPKWNGLNIW